MIRRNRPRTGPAVRCRQVVAEVLSGLDSELVTSARWKGAERLTGVESAAESSGEVEVVVSLPNNLAPGDLACLRRPPSWLCLSVVK